MKVKTIFEVIKDTENCKDYNFKLEAKSQAKLILLIFSYQDRTTSIEVTLAQDTRFEGKIILLAKGRQVSTVNYLVRHLGENSKSQFEMRSYLANQAEKYTKMKGLIVKGAKNAELTEFDRTFLQDNSCRNRSLPMIECAEENVAGKHGMSCGKISEKNLKYLKSRGLSEKNARKLLIKASLMEIMQKQANLAEIEMILDQELENFL